MCKWFCSCGFFTLKFNPFVDSSIDQYIESFTVQVDIDVVIGDSTNIFYTYL